MELSEVIEKFLEYHASDSEATLRAFRSILKAYAEFVELVHSGEIIRREIVIDYLETRREGKRGFTRLSQKSLHLHWNVLSLLAKFTWRKLKLITPDEYEDIKELSRKYKPQTVNRRKALSRKQLHVLEEYIKKLGDPVKTLVFMLGIYGGLRVEEMIELRVSDVYLNPEGRDPFLIARGKGAGKGKKEREVVILPILKQALISYLEYRGILDPKTDHLLITERGHGVSKRTIQHWVKRWSKQTGIVGLTPHVLRHTFAAEMRRRGVNEYDIQMMMGHASISTTANYGRVDAAEVHSRILRRF